MNWARVGLLVVLSVVATSALAADMNGNYIGPVAPNYKSCGSFNNAVVAGNTKDDWSDWNFFKQYVNGYITATNVYLSETYDITGDKGGDAYMGWLEKYCAERPSEDFSNALNQLVVELYPTRTVERPN
jgi:hypothetical protein